VFHVDPDFHRSEQLTFGLRSGAVAALARTAEGIVVAEQPRVGEDLALLTEGSDDLARWRWDALAAQVGPISAIAFRARTLCVAGPGGAGLVELHASGSLPATMTRAVAEAALAAVATRDGCVVGSASGVTLLPWDSAGKSWRYTEIGAVTALAADGEFAWAGTRSGVYLVGSGHFLGRYDAIPAGDPVVALALVARRIAIATPSAVALVDSESTRPLVAPLASVGRITTLASDDQTIWIGGTNGALAVRLDTHAAAPVPLAAPGALEPEPLGGREVRAIVLAPGLAWIGTAAGLVRVRRGADGLPR
jgi:hypothetical protein